MLVAAIVWSLVLTAIVAARNRAATARVRQRSSATGLTLSGDLLGTYTLRGRADGVDVVVENGASKRLPGVRGDDEERAVGVVCVGTRLVDQIVCEATKVDAVMGPLPAVPRVSTGAGMFDARYATFITAGAPPRAVARAPPATPGASGEPCLVGDRVRTRRAAGGLLAPAPPRARRA